MIAGGAIIFFALAPGKFISVLKWTGTQAYEKAIKPGLKAAGEGITKAAEAAGEAVGKIAFVAIAGALVVGGLMMMRKR